MEEKNLDAFIVPSTDAHLSEYPPKYWESRKWISGFTGSAGTAAVTKEKAGVWTDSRYFLQAADELKDTGFDLFKMGQADTPDMTEWIIEQTGRGGTVGIDGLVILLWIRAHSYLSFLLNGFLGMTTGILIAVAVSYLLPNRKEVRRYTWKGMKK